MSKFRFILIVIACLLMAAAGGILLAISHHYITWSVILFGCAIIWLIYGCESFFRDEDNS